MSTLPSSASMLQLWGDSPGCGGAHCNACIHPQFEGLGPQDWLVRVTSCAACRCEIRLYWYLHMYVLKQHEDSGHVLVLTVQIPTSLHPLPFMGNVARSWCFGPL